MSLFCIYFDVLLKKDIFAAFLGQLFIQFIHNIHSDLFCLIFELSVISIFIGQTFLHFPQETHLFLSTVILNAEKRLVGFKKTVIGQTYLQNARLSLNMNARIMPHM